MKPKKKGFLLFASFVLVLFIAEVVVRIFIPQNLTGSILTTTHRGYMVNRADWSAKHQFGDRVVRYRFNSLHLRGEEINPEAKKILVLGDSFTYGWLIEEKSTYVQIFQDLADKQFGKGKFQFLNGAVPGWGTSEQLAFLEDFGDKIDPAGVLVFFNMKDIERALQSRLYQLEDASQLKVKAGHSGFKEPLVKRIVNSLPFYSWVLENCHLLQLVREAYAVIFKKYVLDKKRKEIFHEKGSLKKEPPDLEKGVLLGRALFRRMKTWCEKRKCKLWITTPGWSWAENEKSYSWYFLDQAVDIFGKERIPFFDSRASVEKKISGPRDGFIIPHDKHLNEKGHALVAEAAWPWIRNNLEKF